MLTIADGGGRGGPRTPDFGWRYMWRAPNRWDECQQPLHHHRNQDNLSVSSSSIKQDCEGLALCQWCVQSFKHFRLLIPRIWIRDICITRRRAWIFDFLGGGGRKRGKRQVMPIGSTKKLGFSTPLEYWRKSQFWLNHYIFQGPLRSTSRQYTVAKTLDNFGHLPVNVLHHQNISKQ